jgi:hypothetical protein
MTKVRTKILGLMLTAALLLMLLLPSGVLAAELREGVPALTVNSSVVGFAGQEWYVIGDNESGIYRQADAVTLLAKNHVYGMIAFRVSGNGAYTTARNEYAGSTLQQRMETLADGFSPAESALINARTLTTADGIANTSAANQRLWALSRDEWTTVNNNTVRSFGTYWWLRSPSNTTASNAYYSAANGSSSLSTNIVTGSCAVRPAFSLDLSSVFFTSSANGSGSKSLVTVGSDLVGATAPSGTVKFTVESASQTLEINASAAQSGETLTFGYSDATTGANQVISCVLEQAGVIKYYGKLTDSSSADSGSIAIPFSDVADGDYTLKIFSEQANGDLFTDFCSAPVLLEVRVTDENAFYQGPVDLTELQALYDQIIADLGDREDEFTTGSWANFQDAIALTEGVLEAESPTKDDADAAFAALTETAAALVKRADIITLSLLDAQIRLAEGIEGKGSSAYTAGSWAVFAGALTDARTINANGAAYSTAEAMEAAEALRDAISGLVRLVDKSNLQQYVDAVTEMLLPENAGMYIPAAVEKITPVLERAREVLADTGATQEQVDEAEAELLVCVSEMYTRGDKSGLQTVVNFVSGYAEIDFTPASWEAFAEAMRKAQVVLADENITAEFDQGLIAEKTNDLLAAMRGLVWRADFATLNAAVLRAQEMVANADDYIASTLIGLPRALEQAIAVLENQNASQAEVNAARTALNAEIVKARLKADKSPLIAALNAARALNMNQYTAQSAEPLMMLLSQGDALLSLSDEEFFREEAEAITAKIYEAMNNLVLKITDGNAPGSTVEKGKDGNAGGNSSVGGANIVSSNAGSGSGNGAPIYLDTSRGAAQRTQSEIALRQDGVASANGIADASGIADATGIADADRATENASITGIADGRTPLDGETSESGSALPYGWIIAVAAGAGLILLLMIAYARREREKRTVN